MSTLSDAIDQLRTNERQWDAFEEQGHCAVLAPPGSGKTKLLTTKLAHALATDLVKAPRGAACITMTNEAALQLRRRLRGLGVGRRPNLVIGTVHSFALSRILLPYAASAGREDLAASRVATDAEERVAFDAAFDSMGFEPSERREILQTTKKARQRLDLSGNPLLGGEPVAETARRMQAELARARVYDMYDLIRHAVDLVEQHDWIGRVLAATCPRVYVDEYQDLAPGLDRIVRATTLNSDGDAILFAVGDPDQAINAFAGAHPELLRELAREPPVRCITLAHNYRCGVGIIDVSLRALGADREVTGDRAGGVVTQHPAPGGEAAQTAQALELVQAAVDSGVPYEEIAIITPWAQDRDRCARALRDARIPVYARTDEHWRTTSLTMTLEVMASWASHRDASGVDLHDLLETYENLIPGGHEVEARRRAAAVLLRARAHAGASGFVDELTAGYRQNLRSSDDERELRRMRSALGPDGTACEMTIEELGARARAPGHVMAATIHGAKGLEFDVVILVGADDSAIVGFAPTAEQIAEGRRKFYVSITRARDAVRLVYTNRRRSQWGNPYSVAPCRFIAELGLT